MLLALALSVGMFSACGSDEPEQQDVVLLSEEEAKDVIQDNNDTAKILYYDFDEQFKDLIVEEQKACPGKYFLELTKESYLDEQEREEVYDYFKTVSGFLSKEDTEKRIITIISAELGEYFEKYCPINLYVEVAENGYIESVAYTTNNYINYAGQYPDSTTTKTAFNIYDLKE